ncbi:MAG: hypothetical protein JWN68_3071 [Nocardioides sp.]|uniref:hypothetical protein n=1 Tax=Nocardioides sp. TaxID=35761 RepID=UPI0026059E17|nr:hypothetical protein [Nocardioides sp.]MCW2835118.1 hypothetical protein [Nocardioides sp.]
MNSFFGTGPTPWDIAANGPRPPARASVRTLSTNIEDALIGTFSRAQLDSLLPEELNLTWARDDIDPRDDTLSKRDAIRGYTHGWTLPQLAGLARRLTTEFELKSNWAEELELYIDAYQRDGGGVDGPTKNLIFAANGPKPELVLRDALNNQIEITANAEFCLVYDHPVPPEGLWLSHLIRWWREREEVPDWVEDRAVALALHERLRGSLADNRAEQVIFDAYAARYKEGFNIPALIPQVYLHFDPVTQRARRAAANGSPLARQRMDFLLLFSDRQRVVIEVDGKQHYAKGSTASPELYSQMVAEDRRLRLDGYEVYRFGGYELTENPDAPTMVKQFFDKLADNKK